MPDREKVIEAFDEAKELVWTDIDEYTVGYNNGLEAGKNIALAMLKEQDKGHWTPYEPDKRGYTDGFVCSRCERVILSDHYCKMIDFDFCPYCGAYMDDAEGL